MRRLLAILGVLACSLSGLVLCASLLIPMALTPFSAFFCEPNERLTGEVWTTSSGNRSSIGTSYVCVDAAGRERVVTPEVTRGTTMTFLALMFGGMGLLAVGSWQQISANQARKTKRKHDEGIGFEQLQGFQSDSMTVSTTHEDVTSAEMGHAGDISQRLFELLDQPIHAEQGKLDLTDALQELGDARAKGLISEEEYHKLRQRVMDRFG